MFRKSRAVFAISVAACIAACAGPQPKWQKEGVSADDAYNALSQCKYQVGLNKVAEDKQNELIANCMEGNGFRWR